MKISQIILTNLILIFCFFTSFSQNSNDEFNYSEIARNATGEPILNSTIQVQIAIHFETKESMAKYIENHEATTNGTGKFTVVIGTGTPVAGNYSNLPWGFQKSYIETFINGLSISNKEINKPRAYGKYNNPNKVINPNIQSNANKNINNIDLNNIPLNYIKVGDKTLKPGKGILFFGKSPNHTIQLQDIITITAGEGIEIDGTYPNLVINLKKHFIGEEYLGGKVAYVDETGQHGFVVYCYTPEEAYIFEKSTWATFDWGESQRVNDDLTSSGFSGITYKNWDKYGDVETVNTEINSDDFDDIGNLNAEIGYGWINTKRLMEMDNIYKNIPDVGELRSIPQILHYHGDGRWILPSFNELKEIYKNKNELGLTNINEFIWSSTESYKQISQGIRDKFNGTNYTQGQYFEGYNGIPVRLSKTEKILGVLCLNFSNGKETTIAKTYGNRFFLIKEF